MREQNHSELRVLEVWSLQQAWPTCGGLREPAWLFLTGTGLKATLTHRGNWPRGALVVFKLHGAAQCQPGLCNWGCFAPSPGSSPPPWVPAPLHSTQKQLMQAHRAGAKGQSPLWAHPRVSANMSACKVVGWGLKTLLQNSPKD